MCIPYTLIVELAMAPAAKELWFLLTSEVLQPSQEDITVQPHEILYAYHGLYLCNCASYQSQLYIFCSPIPALQNNIGFMLLATKVP